MTALDLSLLILDDEPSSVELLAAALRQPGVEILTASDPEQGLDLVFEHRPTIVLTDLRMPGLSGIEVLERIAEFDPSISVVLMTAHYSSESAVEAIKKGAADYLNKPVPLAVLRERVSRLLEDARQRKRAQEIEEELLASTHFEGIVGRSPLMWDMFGRIRRVAPHFRSVLITGQTGTGKDLAARTLHALSPASGGRYVVLNCSAVVETLFESELFGHVKGSFTGATQDKIGMFEHANGGTIFLDEIGDMPLSTQAKLLRVLQNQEVLRVGSLTPRKIEVRVIAATNHDLREAIEEKRFREDLYYRLSMVEIEVPPLSARKEDLPLLERHFVHKFAKQFGKEIRGLTQRAQIRLARHGWPGNVRELENVIGHASMMVMGDTIDLADLPLYLQTPGGTMAAAPMVVPEEVSSLDQQERELLVKAMDAAHGNQSGAARILRIGRDALRYKMKKHGLG